jgi:hypothetical protein
MFALVARPAKQAQASAPRPEELAGMKEAVLEPPPIASQGNPSAAGWQKWVTYGVKRDPRPWLLSASRVLTSPGWPGFRCA